MIKLAPLLVVCLAVAGAACQSSNSPSPKSSSDMNQASLDKSLAGGSGQIEVATLGGGCFWCVEAVYQELQGVLKVESGYSGGTVSNPTYREVCSGATGHAEVIQVSFDPAIVPYSTILEVFFSVHDPTTLNRQGNDVGTQYRSVIYYHSEAQKAAAESAKANVATTIWDDPIVTEISPFDVFYKAEDYHQNYFKDNPSQPYCSFVVAPKVKKFREKYKALLKQ